MLLDIADYLQSNGVGITGANVDGIFVYSMPEDAVPAVLLLDPPDGVPIDHELPDYYKTTFQIVVRHTEHQEGRALADEVSDVLNFENRAIGDFRFNYIRPKHQPYVFPGSKGEFLEFSINFETSFVLTN